MKPLIAIISPSGAGKKKKKKKNVKPLRLYGLRRYPIIMNKKNRECISFHPGYYISEIIDDLEITQEEFAVRLGSTAKTISKLVNGEANITNDLAMKLSNMLNTSPEVWLNLQMKYDLQLAEMTTLPLTESIDTIKAMLSDCEG